MEYIGIIITMSMKHNRQIILIMSFEWQAEVKQCLPKWVVGGRENGEREQHFPPEYWEKDVIITLNERTQTPLIMKEVLEVTRQYNENKHTTGGWWVVLSEKEGKESRREITFFNRHNTIYSSPRCVNQKKKERPPHCSVQCIRMCVCVCVCEWGV